MAGDQRFVRLWLEDWRQFHTVDLDLSRRLTVLTGENGTGKTSLLGLLGVHFQYTRSFVGSPRHFADRLIFVAGKRLPFPGQSNFAAFAYLAYASGATAEIGSWENSGPEFQPVIQNQQAVPGLYLDSHRVVSGYGRVESVPPRFSPATQISQEFRSQLRSWWTPNVIRKSPTLVMKETLIAAAIYGEGNSSITPDPSAADVWTGFQEVLRALLPASLGFTRLRVEQAEVLLDTRSGLFALESISGGISALFEIAWQIFLQSREEEAFTVCFDEPENHLHPSLQRSILPSLLKAFPKVNFIVATHSPFVVTSYREAAVYILRRNGEGRVYSESLDLQQQALRVDEVLRDVLGVGSTLPVWAESKFNEIMAAFVHRPPTAETLRTLSAALEDAGLRLSVPSAVSVVTDEERRAASE